MEHPGEKRLYSFHCPSEQPWTGPRRGPGYFPSSFLKTANVTGSRVPFGKFPPFLSIECWQPGSVLQPLPWGDTDQALWRRAWGQGIYTPQGSLLSLLLFCTATTPLSACRPWAWPLEYDIGGAPLVGFHQGLRLAACGVRGMLMLQGWRDVGGGVLFAVSTRSPVSRSVTWPTAAMRRNQQRGGRCIGGLRGEAYK